MSTHKIIRKNQFAYRPVTSSNFDKISIALLADCEEAIMNKSFESFGKNVVTGTKYYSTIKDGKNIFSKKNYSIHFKNKFAK